MPTGTAAVLSHLLYNAFGNVYDAFGNGTRTARCQLIGSRRLMASRWLTASRRRDPAVDFLLLFTRRPFDADTGLQNNLNRWYDPAVGRWLSEDPIGFTAGDENLYRYVGNGVLRTIDPLGLGDRQPEDPFDAMMLGLITQEEANYFYGRSREELRAYLEWRVREGRDDRPALLFLFDFLRGTGDTNRYYGQASPDTWQMRNSPGGQRLREAFYAEGCCSLIGDHTFEYRTWDAAKETGPFAPHYWNTRPFQVGGFMGQAIYKGDGTVTFTITNKAGLYSFAFHQLPDKPWNSGPMRTITQTFVWTERIDYARCSCPSGAASLGLEPWDPWNRRPWSSGPEFFFNGFPRLPRE